MTIFSSYEWHLWKKLLICIVGSTGVIFIIKNIFKQQLLFEHLYGVNESLDQFEQNDDHRIDPLSPIHSKHCTVPYAEHLPLIQYALMVDAGSTGSRIHVYRFNYCGPSPFLEDEIYREVKPGLSFYSEDPEAAADSLDPLFQVAVNTVPASLQSCTPIVVRATAGLRLLGFEESEAILRAVTNKIQTQYPFLLPKNDGVIVMDGKDEGIYAWITINYLLGKIGDENRLDTVAIMDLGGGSTQIVFEPSLSNNNYDKRNPYLIPKKILNEKDGNNENDVSDNNDEDDYRVELTFGHFNYVLYQHSYLGYGLMEARKTVMSKFLDIEEIMSSASSEKEDSNKENANENINTNVNSNTLMTMENNPYLVVNPCFPESFNHSFSIKGQSVKIVGSRGVNFNDCSKVIKFSLFNKTIPCPTEPCSFNGIYQPSLEETFSRNDIYAFSYFYDRTTLLDISLNPEVEDIAELARKICRQRHMYDWQTENDPYLCLDLTYLYTLLNYGYSIHPSKKIFLAKKINEVEAGWCLGATLQMLDGMVHDGILNTCIKKQ